MSDPKFQVGDPVEFFDEEEQVVGTVEKVSDQGDTVWYRIRTQLDEIAFMKEEDLDLSYA